MMDRRQSHHSDTIMDFGDGEPRHHQSASYQIDRIDEGFSEAMDLEEPAPARTPEPIEVDQPQNTLSQEAYWRNLLLSQPVELRAILARELMASLPTSQVALLVQEAHARLHLDPVTYLPVETSTHLFRYLSPKDLINCALVSRAWRDCTYQPTVWRKLFRFEGWHSRPEAIRKFQQTAVEQLELYRANFDPQQHLGERPTRSSKIFVKDGSLGLLVPSKSIEGAPSPNDHSLTVSALIRESPIFTRPGPSFICPLLHPSHSWDLARSHLQLNWRYLFSQRQRLERNWQSGLFKNFRLPREDHDHQKHGECIYTLQFSNKYVVSGSRDRTVRVWDLETQVLKLQPLVGHKGSVLCLQFDEDPERDVIVSGGSDSCIIVWKFSTGETIKHIQKAHSQAVLNLRFDRRYLVTCSKDNSIKVWNMQRLNVHDDAYPAVNRSRDATYPDYILDKSAWQQGPSHALPPPIEPFNVLMQLNGHSAAVNAIAIFGDEIVSVSGDRRIVRWKLSTGKFLKEIRGHDKGIACVDYDGRRIVSGSSDESVRIFDPETAAQVALLQGHKDLVRTIQADFGDVPGDEELYEARARAHTEKVLRNEHRRRMGEPCPTQQDEPYIVGAKLPPGGGGNRWAKIISGSYDETIIIWKQNKNGQWVISKTLRHEDAVKATMSRRPPPPPDNRGPLGGDGRPTTASPPHTGPSQRRPSQSRDAFALPRTSGITTLQILTLQGYLDLSPAQIATLPSDDQARYHSMLQHSIHTIHTQTPAQISSPDNQARLRFLQLRQHQLHAAFGAAALHAPLVPGTIPQQQWPHLLEQLASRDRNQQQIQHMQRQQTMQRQQQAYQQTRMPGSTASAAPPAPPASPTGLILPAAGPPGNYTTIASPPAAASTSPAPYPPFDPTTSVQQQQQQHQQWLQRQQQHNLNQRAIQLQQHGPQTQQQQEEEEGTSRLFKLQFDARRIVCCSQQQVIVGWDFANGEQNVIEASQFFGETA